MKNKKGFTLTELIGVIVLLGIIALISIPILNKTIKNSKEKAYNAQVDEIVSSAKKWGVTNNQKLPDSKYVTTVVTVTELMEDGFLEEDNILDPRDDSSLADSCIKVKYDTSKDEYSYIFDKACTPEVDLFAGTAYALVLDNSADADDSLPLIFVRSETEIKAGDTYNSDTYGSVVVKGAYTGFEETTYNGYKNFTNDPGFAGNIWGFIGAVLDTPWSSYVPEITSIIFEDYIRFMSVESLFSGYPNVSYVNAEKIDLSKNNSLASMFNEIGHEWNTDNCHLGGGCSDIYIGGTSVTIEGIEEWTTHNINDMEAMFYDARIQTIGDISQWDTSNVINMNSMFLLASISDSNVKLDLSKWNVDKVVNWDNFYYGWGDDDPIIVPEKFKTES